MSMQPLPMPCPKCTAPMRTLERSGVHLETCPECRGIFLDRGELDRLIDLEADAASWPDGARGDRFGAGRREIGRGPLDDGPPAGWADDEGVDRWTDRRGQARRRGFLGELFEGFGD